MIEVPSAAVTAPTCLPCDADFFSIGTNDLIQYCLAVDRTDDRVIAPVRAAASGNPADRPDVARAGRRAGIPVSVCGEMAADPALLALLVGLGLREFSMAPAAHAAGEAGGSKPARRRSACGSRRALRADRKEWSAARASC